MSLRCKDCGLPFRFNKNQTHPICTCDDAEEQERAAGNVSYNFFGGWVDYYEKKSNQLQLLHILKDSLTPKGLETYNKIEKYLEDNLGRYLTESQKQL